MVLPYDTTVQVLYFNGDLLRARSAPLPTDRWTLDDLLAAAQKAARKNGDQLDVAGYDGLKGTSGQDAAWLYLKHMVSSDVLLDMVGQPRRSVPGRVSVAKTVAADGSVAPRNWRVIVPVTEKARHITFGLTPKGGDILQEVTPALTRVYAGGTNVKTEMDGLAQRINAILGGG